MLPVEIATRLSRIAFIGVSRAENSRNADLLKTCGYRVFCIDKLIEEGLRPILDEAGLSHLDTGDATTEWMGMPGDEDYTARQAEYLDLEDVLTGAILLDVAQLGITPVVLDASRSIPHLNPSILRQLTTRMTVVYLEIAESDIKKLCARYLAQPTPECFGEHWKPLARETYDDSIARCYHDLLTWRSEQYTALATVTLRASELQNISALQLLSVIEEKLAALPA